MNHNLKTIEYNNSIITLDLNGGTLISWINSGEEVFYRGTSHRRSGIPILFPFANPLHDGIFKNSGLQIGQHGFARDLVWKLESTQESSISISLSTNDISEEMQLAYPYKFKAIIIIDLKKAAVLQYTLRVENLDLALLPIAPGLHPYFPIKQEEKSKLSISDANNKPIFTGIYTNWDEPSDGIFNNYEGLAKIQFPDGKQIQIAENSKNPDFQNLVVWSQPGSQLDSNFICVEPFTRGTDAINKNPILVEPGKNWEVSLQFILVK